MIWIAITPVRRWFNQGYNNNRSSSWPMSLETSRGKFPPFKLSMFFFCLVDSSAIGSFPAGYWLLLSEFTLSGPFSMAYYCTCYSSQVLLLIMLVHVIKWVEFNGSKGPSAWEAPFSFLTLRFTGVHWLA
jgi:hypothetical protein